MFKVVPRKGVISHLYSAMQTLYKGKSVTIGNWWNTGKSLEIDSLKLASKTPQPQLSIWAAGGPSS